MILRPSNSDRSSYVQHISCLLDLELALSQTLVARLVFRDRHAFERRQKGTNAVGAVMVLYMSYRQKSGYQVHTHIN